MKKRYGNVHELNEDILWYKKTLLLGIKDAPWEEFVSKNEIHIKDLMANETELLLLPKDRKHAAGLFNACFDKNNSNDQEEWTSLYADEVSWIKIGDEYWLRLWRD